jgi:hypothetical protein
MKITNQEQDTTASFSYSSSSSSISWGRTDGVWEYWSAEIRSLPTSEFRQRMEILCQRGIDACTTIGEAGGRPYRVFCGLVLELFARPVITNETVLPKAAVTAGKMILGLNLSVASAALRDARQRYLWKGEW